MRSVAREEQRRKYPTAFLPAALHSSGYEDSMGIIETYQFISRRPCRLAEKVRQTCPHTIIRDLSSSQDLGSDNPQSMSRETSDKLAGNNSKLHNGVDFSVQNEALFVESLLALPHLFAHYLTAP